MKLLPAKRTVKRWAIGLSLVLGVLLIANGFMSWRTDARFRQLVEEVRAEGDPTTIAELKPAPISDEANAAAMIDQLSPRLREFSAAYSQFYRTELGKTLEGLPPDTRPSPVQIAAVQAILDEHAELQELISAAVSAPNYASTADFSRGFQEFLEAELPRMGRLRDIARLVDWQVEVLIAEDRRPEAADRALGLLRLSVMSQTEPTVVSYLVTLAVRSMALRDIHKVLAAGPVGVETNHAIDAALRTVEEQRSLSAVLRTERAVSISASVEQWGRAAPAPLMGFIGWPMKRHYLAPLEHYARLMPHADRPWHEAKALWAPGGELATPTGLGVLADLLNPALQAAFEADARDQALVRALRVYNAVQQLAPQQRPQAAQPAATLDQLALPAETTIDPFTGKPLVLRRVEGGWLVYSLGANEADDGGDFAKGKDVGFGPRLPPGEHQD